MSTCELNVGGMDCASCAATIERALRKLEGVKEVRIDVVAGKVRVGHADALGRDQLVSTIRRVGYTVEEESASRAAAIPASAAAGGAPARTPGFWQRHGHLAAAMVAGLGVALGLAARWLDFPSAVELTLLGLATIAGGWFVLPKGLRAARNRSLDMNFLMSVAAAGAWAIGQPEEAAATLFLFAVAELLEDHSMDRARNAIKALIALSLPEATVLRGGNEVRVRVEEIAVGETIVVRPGEKIPLDGAVTAGGSSVNEAPITGESMPVDKAVGASVFAGSLNGTGVLEVRSSRPANDTTLARIVHAVEEAQGSRAPSQSFVDRFARVYTPAVVGLALVLAVLVPLLGWGTWDTWIYRSLAMLVIACPCALVISTPVTLVSALAGAARGGVLIKGGLHLENAAGLTAVCFDKTGTLTEGRPAVTDILPLNGRSPDEILRLALAVEWSSEHSLARAVLEAGAERGIQPPASTEFQSLMGRGARARLDGGMIYVGSPALLAEIGLDGHVGNGHIEALEAAGKTAVLVSQATSEGAEAVGVLGLADRVRPNAAAALSQLRRLGIGRLVMLTGDNAGTASAVAGTLGITEVHSGLLPADKVRAVRQLEAAGERVAVVGDGVNDAPALAAATVGVAMGVAGTDVALETADIALMADDLEKLSFAVAISRKALGIIKQNITFAIAVKAVFVVLAAVGWATLWMAVAADMGASLLVVANGMRARRV